MNVAHAPSPMPIFAPTDRWDPHLGNPGIPHRPALSVKLNICRVTIPSATYHKYKDLYYVSTYEHERNAKCPSLPLK